MLPTADGRSARMRMGGRATTMGERLAGKLTRASAVAIAAITAAFFSGRDANALTYSDILGNWCSATARLEFSRNAMGVFLFSSKSHSSTRVTKYEFAGSIVTVYWDKDG